MRMRANKKSSSRAENHLNIKNSNYTSNHSCRRNSGEWTVTRSETIESHYSTNERECNLKNEARIGTNRKFRSLENQFKISSNVNLRKGKNQCQISNVGSSETQSENRSEMRKDNWENETRSCSGKIEAVLENQVGVSSVMNEGDLEKHFKMSSDTNETSLVYKSESRSEVTENLAVINSNKNECRLENQVLTCLNINACNLKSQAEIISNTDGFLFGNGQEMSLLNERNSAGIRTEPSSNKIELKSNEGAGICRNLNDRCFGHLAVTNSKMNYHCSDDQLETNRNTYELSLESEKVASLNVIESSVKNSKEISQNMIEGDLIKKHNLCCTPTQTDVCGNEPSSNQSPVSENPSLLTLCSTVRSDKGLYSHSKFDCSLGFSDVIRAGKMVSCAYCSKQFSVQMELIAHTVEHSAFPTKRKYSSAFTQHSRVHSDEMLLSYSECNAQMNLLDTNDAEKMLSCAYCPKRFSVQTELILHTAKKHPCKGPLRCTLCSKGFFVAAALKHHMETMHCVDTLKISSGPEANELKTDGMQRVMPENLFTEVHSDEGQKMLPLFSATNNSRSDIIQYLTQGHSDEKCLGFASRPTQSECNDNLSEHCDLVATENKNISQNQVRISIGTNVGHLENQNKPKINSDKNGGSFENLAGSILFKTKHSLENQVETRSHMSAASFDNRSKIGSGINLGSLESQPKISCGMFDGIFENQEESSLAESKNNWENQVEIRSVMSIGSIENQSKIGSGMNEGSSVNKAVSSSNRNEHGLVGNHGRICTSVYDYTWENFPGISLNNKGYIFEIGGAIIQNINENNFEIQTETSLDQNQHCLDYRKGTYQSLNDRSLSDRAVIGWNMNGCNSENIMVTRSNMTEFCVKKETETSYELGLENGVENGWSMNKCGLENKPLASLNNNEYSLENVTKTEQNINGCSEKNGISWDWIESSLAVKAEPSLEKDSCSSQSAEYNDKSILDKFKNPFLFTQHSRIKSDETPLTHFKNDSLANPAGRKDTVKMVFCAYCPKQFAVGTELILHSAKHFRKRPLWCPLCPEALSDVAGLKLHMGAHNDKG